MAENKIPEANLTRARELLSPYLDGEVSGEERALVEQGLAESAELRRELETLRQTVALLAALPPVPAPRPFTLSEADVQGVSRAPRGFFGLPNWLSGLAVAAATLICVFAAGGFFLTRQFSGAPAELARAPESAATEAAAAVEETVPTGSEATRPAELPAQKAAPAEPLATEEAVQEAPPAAEAPVQEAAPAPEAPALEEKMAEAEAGAANQAAPTATPAAALAEPPPEGTARQADTAQDSASSGGPSAGAVAPTPAPLATPAVQVTTEEYSLAEAEQATGEGATAAEAPDESMSMAQQGRGGGGGGRIAQPVAIDNLKVQITTSLIQVEGVIPAQPGLPVQASLQRNGEPFDEWADPPTLRTVVQPGGRFYLAIQAAPDRPDQDLYAAEPAQYQVILTSGGSAPVTAVVSFDTAGPPVPAGQPASTTTPLPSPTALVQVEPSPLPTLPVQATAAPATSSPGWMLAWGVVASLAILASLGLIVWFYLRRQR